MSFSAFFNGYLFAALAFTIQIVFCEAMFCVNLKKREKFVLRLILSVVVYLLCSFGIFMISGLFPQTLSSAINYIGMVLYYLITWIMTFIILCFCFKISWEELIFIWIGGYSLQHIGFSISVFIRYFVKIDLNGFVFFLLFEILPFLFVGAIAYFLLIKPSEKKGELKIHDVRMILLAAVLLLSCIALSALSNLFSGEDAQTVSILICRPYSAICSVLILLIMYGFLRRNKLEYDNELMEFMIHLVKDQNKLESENIEVINMKCHDLKHQIAALKNIDNQIERNEAILEVEKAVQIYDSSIKSGNDAMDLILTQKNLLCENYHIKLSCIVNGAKLDFMNMADIYSLFGNALDNAIEHVIQEENKEHRIISFRISTENNMIYIHVDNYCTKKLVFEEGVPVTTKSDIKYHGFGTRSIKYIVNKYGGDVNMYQDDEKFNLDILFKLNATKEMNK